MYLRGNPKWKSLFPTLKKIGIEVVVQSELSQIETAYRRFLTAASEDHSAGAIKPTTEQSQVETIFPSITKWVNDYGSIEIGDQEGFGVIARTLDYGGQVFEDDKSDTLAEAMAALEQGLKK